MQCPNNLLLGYKTTVQTPTNATNSSNRTGKKKQIRIYRKPKPLHDIPNLSPIPPSLTTTLPLTPFPPPPPLFSFAKSLSPTSTSTPQSFANPFLSSFPPRLNTQPPTLNSQQSPPQSPHPPHSHPRPKHKHALLPPSPLFSLSLSLSPLQQQHRYSHHECSVGSGCETEGNSVEVE